MGAKKVPSYPLRKYPSGLIMVMQYSENGITLSFNPDDDKFYISDTEHDALRIHKYWRNAVHFYKQEVKKAKQ